MAKVSSATASEVESAEGFEGRYEHVDGGYTIGFETFTASADFAPVFKGLPDDRCQAPHWGYVFEGTLIFHYADGSTDVINAGEAYYAPPGHTPEMKAGTKLVEFSPTEPLKATIEVVMRNMAEMGA